jgi:hypothetical protein
LGWTLNELREHDAQDIRDLMTIETYAAKVRGSQGGVPDGD